MSMFMQTKFGIISHSGASCAGLYETSGRMFVYCLSAGFGSVNLADIRPKHLPSDSP